MKNKKQFIFIILLFILKPLLSDEIYTVQRGDTLSRISTRFEISVKELKEINKLTNDQIRVGQKLIVKKLSTQKPVYYTVRAGDNLSSIARRNNTTISQIVEWNELKSSNIRINQSLIVGFEKPAENKKEVEVVKEKEIFHIVQKGETLTSISRLRDIDVMDLLDYNKLTSFVITPGQRIWLEDGHVTETKSEELPTDLPVISKESGSTTIATHIVRRGENLYRIALNYKVTVDDLRRWNKLSSVNIREGQVLYLMDVSGIPNFDETVKRQPATTTQSSRSAILPVSRVNIISDYGMRSGRLHKGIDFSGSPGDPIYAVLHGKVVFAGVQRGFGNIVIIEHENFVMTVYAHNESNLVTVGDEVTQGQIIATIGSTGNASAPHVHFEYRVRGVARNPKELLTQLK